MRKILSLLMSGVVISSSASYSISCSKPNTPNRKFEFFKSDFFEKINSEGSRVYDYWYLTAVFHNIDLAKVDIYNSSLYKIKESKPNKTVSDSDELQIVSSYWDSMLNGMIFNLNRKPTVGSFVELTFNNQKTLDTSIVKKQDTSKDDFMYSAYYIKNNNYILCSFQGDDIITDKKNYKLVGDEFKKAGTSIASISDPNYRNPYKIDVCVFLKNDNFDFKLFDLQIQYISNSGKIFSNAIMSNF